MEEEREVIVSGYCRAWNQSRTVVCEYRESREGILLVTDCDYPDCVHSGSCEVIKKVGQDG